jgi:chromosome segregation ATPase
VAKDEHVRVLSEQNKQMLGLLETEENKSKAHSEQIRILDAKNRKLQKIAEEFDVAKADLEKQVTEAKGKCADIVASVRGQRGVNENLRANIQNTEAKTRVDIEALGQALEVVDKKNLEYITRINKQESRDQQLQAETGALKEELEAVRGDIDHLRKQLEGDEEGRTKFERARSQMEQTIEALEVQADTLKKALSTAERANEQLQEENRTSADRCRETADKVYALMDSLRLNQVELKKQEAENGAKHGGGRSGEGNGVGEEQDKPLNAVDYHDDDRGRL